MLNDTQLKKKNAYNFVTVTCYWRHTYFASDFSPPSSILFKFRTFLRPGRAPATQKNRGIMKLFRWFHWMDPGDLDELSQMNGTPASLMISVFYDDRSGGRCYVFSNKERYAGKSQ